MSPQAHAANASRPPARQGRAARGFTLIELMIVVAITGIAAAIGMPMMSQFVQNTMVSTQADLVLGALNFTRSEAVKRNTRVTMCRSASGTSCGGGTVGDWRKGWVVFVDADPVGVLDVNDEILRVQGQVKGKGKLFSTGEVMEYVSYVGNGQTRLGNGGAQTGNFISCVDSTVIKRRQIALSPGTGWVGATVQPAVANCI